MKERSSQKKIFRLALEWITKTKIKAKNVKCKLVLFLFFFISSEETMNSMKIPIGHKFNQYVSVKVHFNEQVQFSFSFQGLSEFNEVSIGHKFNQWGYISVVTSLLEIT